MKVLGFPVSSCVLWVLIILTSGSECMHVSDTVLYPWS